MKIKYLMTINLLFFIFSLAAFSSAYVPNIRKCSTQCIPKTKCNDKTVASMCAILCSQAKAPAVLEAYRYCFAVSQPPPPPLPRDTAKPLPKSGPIPTSTPSTGPTINELTDTLYNYFDTYYNAKYLDDIDVPNRFIITKDLTQKIVTNMAKSLTTNNFNSEIESRTVIQFIKSYINDKKLKFPDQDRELIKLGDMIKSQLTQWSLRK